MFLQWMESVRLVVQGTNPLKCSCSDSKGQIFNSQDASTNRHPWLPVTTVTKRRHYRLFLKTEPCSVAWLAWNSQSSACLHLPGARVKGVYLAPRPILWRRFLNCGSQTPLDCVKFTKRERKPGKSFVKLKIQCRDQITG